MMPQAIQLPQKQFQMILQGHVIDCLKKLPDESVDLVCTSPPYYGLRDYGEDTKVVWGGRSDCAHSWGEEEIFVHQQGNPSGESAVVGATKLGIQKPKGLHKFCSKCGAYFGQLGLEPSFHLYIHHILQVCAELKRVLNPTGAMWLNLGDTYSGSGGAGGDYNAGGLREGQPRYKQGDSKLPAKCAIGIPERIMLALIDDGWILRNKICWSKINAMPSSVKDRLSNRWEVVYFFVKSNETQYWTNSKTKMLVSKQPLGSKGVEGTDWDWGWKELDPKRHSRVIKRLLEQSPDLIVESDEKRLVYDPWLGEEVEKVKHVIYGWLKKSHWRGHDYWFDLDAIRVPHETHENRPPSIVRAREWNYETKPSKNPEAYLTNPKPRKEDIFYGEDHNAQPNDRSHFGIGSAISDRYKSSDVRGNPLGKNLGDVWEINTEPHPFAHFACFHSKLIENPIKATCPSEVCINCGKARERITKSETLHKWELPKDHPQYRPRSSYPSEGENSTMAGFNLHKDSRYKGLSETLGWSTCSCQPQSYRAGTTLDPFACRSMVCEGLWSWARGCSYPRARKFLYSFKVG